MNSRGSKTGFWHFTKETQKEVKTYQASEEKECNNCDKYEPKSNSGIQKADKIDILIFLARQGVTNSEKYEKTGVKGEISHFCWKNNLIESQAF